jgi:hypothetical protein
MSPALPPVRTVGLSPISGPISISPSVPGAVSAGGSAGKCKHSALDDASGNDSPSLSFLTSASREKKSRVGGGSAVMNRLNDTLDGLGAHLAKVEQQQQQLAVIQDTSPERRSKAMHKLQKDEPNLDMSRLTALVDLFKCSTEAADTYLALFRDDLRKHWIEKQLTESLGFPPLSPLDMTA